MRFDYYGQGDTRDFTDGDSQFLGINMTLGRELLQPGFLSLGQNTRLRTGGCRQRPGTVRPSDFNPTGGFSNYLIGSGVFRNPNSEEILMVAPANAEYAVALQYGKDPYVVNYAAAVTGNNGVGGVEFVQAFDKLLLLRRPSQGSPAQNLVWDGTGDVNRDGIADTEFEVMALSPEGLTLVPGAWHGEPFQDRIIYYDANYQTVSPLLGRDSWILSDVEDYTSYDDIYQAFRSNSGKSDFITRIMEYFDESVVIFKNQSILQSTFSPTFSTVPPFLQRTERILSTRLGSIGTNMPLAIGGDVIFFSMTGGFYRLSEVIQQRINVLPTALSEPIQRVVDQIQIGATGIYGCSVALDNYALFGVALGPTAARPNAILVLDTQNNQWVSAPDTWSDPGFGFNNLHVTNYDGVQRVFAIDYLHGAIYLMYEGTMDELQSGLWQVPFRMETRGYVGGDSVSFKKFRRSMITIAASNPSINVTAITDGVNEEKLLTPDPITKDRLRFYTHGHKLFEPEADDPDEPLREDYSLGDDDNVAIEDFEILPIGPLLFIPETGLPVAGPKQECTEPLYIGEMGRHISLRVESNQGICDVLAISVEGNKARNTIRTAA